MKLSTLPIEIFVKFDSLSDEYLMKLHCGATAGLIKIFEFIYIFKLH